MLEFLGDNLFIVIAIVLFIVVRGIAAKRKRAAASEEDEAATETSSVDDNDDDRTISLGHWEIEKESQPKPTPPPNFSRKTLEAAAQKPFTSLAESAPLSFADKIVKPADVYSAPAYGEPTPNAPAPAESISSPNSSAPDLSALDQLPELKRAIVFSEILAPPIALR
jgi:FtsZ-interacting cell division protein ZipA